MYPMYPSFYNGYPRRPYQPYYPGYAGYGAYPYYGNYIGNQVSAVNQSLFNSGVMAGVNQIAYSNNIRY